MTSKCTNDEGLEHKANQVIQQNISAILSNGVHCSYLLNTMSNSSTLSYSNYTFDNNGHKHNNHPNQTTPLNLKSNSNASTSTISKSVSVGPITNINNTINTEQDLIPNCNININNNLPLYIYSQNINHHYPQPQHHHYHLFQMAQHQQLSPYALNPYKYTTNNNLTSSPYILNPYDPHIPHTLHCTQQAPRNSSKPNIPLFYDEGKDSLQNPTTKENINDGFSQIVSIPDEFASAINDDFSEMIGMQDVKEKQLQMNNANDTQSTATSATVQDNEANDDSIEEDKNCNESKWQNEAFIAKKKRQIISFLKLWDSSYPDTSQNGEENNAYKKADDDEEEGYHLPPGLHNKYNGKPLNNEGQNELNESPKYFLQSPSYEFNGCFEEAKRLGIQQNKWIMLNICDTDLFTAQWSNPLVWRHKRYGLHIKQNFIYFNVMKFAENAINFVNVYNIQNVPSVCIIDPHSNVKRFEFVAPSTSTNIVQLRKDILHLLDTFPNPMDPMLYNCNKEHDSMLTKPRKPPIPHKYNQHRITLNHVHYKQHVQELVSVSSSSATSAASISSWPISNASNMKSEDEKNDDDREEEIIITPITPSPRKKKKNRFHFTSSLEISSSPHIYCASSPTSNIWDLCYPYTNLRHNAYILSTRQTFDWNDWMLIIKKSKKIIGAIPAEQHIEFLRNRNGEMTLESSGTYNGWWSEQRIAEYVVNEKFGLSFEGGFASENGRKRKKFLKTLELPRRPTFKKMLVIIPNITNEDKILFHENSLSMTSYLEYDKMDNITSFQLWLSFITYLSVNTLESSSIYKTNQIKCNQCTNFCIKLGSKWKLPLTTLYNDVEALISNQKCKEILFSFPKIATDATTHGSASYSGAAPHANVNVNINKYHHLSNPGPGIEPQQQQTFFSSGKKNSGLEIAFLSRSNNKNNTNGSGYKFDCKRTTFVKSYAGLKEALLSTKCNETIDFPFPLCSSGWFSFNTLSLFATILEQHLNGTWVSMFSLNSRKQFKQIFDINKNTRRRSIIYSKLLQQKINEENYKNNLINLSNKLSTKNKKRLKLFWNENRLYWTDLIIDKNNKEPVAAAANAIQYSHHQHHHDQHHSHLHKNHNNRNYRKKRKPRSRNRNRSRRKHNNSTDDNNII